MGGFDLVSKEMAENMFDIESKMKKNIELQRPGCGCGLRTLRSLDCSDRFPAQTPVPVPSLYCADPAPATSLSTIRRSSVTKIAGHKSIFILEDILSDKIDNNRQREIIEANLL